MVVQYYAVLVRISPGYSPLTGRLHTCYSPVRRSPPKVLLLYVLPLDLHVLGLSLAFILSQDQTLRCIFFICSDDSLLFIDVGLSPLKENLSKVSCNWRGIKKIPFSYTTFVFVLILFKDRSGGLHYHHCFITLLPDASTNLAVGFLCLWAL